MTDKFKNPTWFREAENEYVDSDVERKELDDKLQAAIESTSDLTSIELNTLIRYLKQKKKQWSNPEQEPKDTLGRDITDRYERRDWYARHDLIENYFNIWEFTIWETAYRYNKKQFSLTKFDNKIILTETWSQDWKEIDISGETPKLKWYTFEDWWIRRVDKIKDGDFNIVDGENEGEDWEHENNIIDKDEDDELIYENLDNLKNKNWKTCNEYDRFAIKYKNWTVKYYSTSEYHNLRTYDENFKHDETISYTKNNRTNRYHGLNHDLGEISAWFKAIFNNTYEDVKSIYEHKNDTLTNTRLARLWELRWINWWKKNRIKLAKWCMMDDSPTLTWWKNFLDWCEEMKKKWLDDNGLTIWNWLAFSKIDWRDWDIKKIYYREAI